MKIPGDKRKIGFIVHNELIIVYNKGIKMRVIL